MDRFEVHQVPAGDVNALTQHFQSFLVRKGMRSGSPRYTPLENTIDHIAKLGARTVLVQKDVQDPDFLAEHEAYYSKWSYKVPRFCDRLHFFNLDPISTDPLELIDQMHSAEDSYLGFVTLRPISVSPQAATILRPVGHGMQHFILSRDGFRVNIAGRSFNVVGTPFMQQDNAVGACAQASIWMALRTLRRREGHSAFSPAQITNAATRFLVTGRTLPNRGGLIVEQITEALRTAGYAPHNIPLRKLEKPATDDSLAETRKSLYPYIESGIPVLMVLFPERGEGHAVLLIGHGWSENPASLIENGEIRVSAKSQPIKIYDASSWVEPLFIHNDNTGPYLQIPEDGEQYSLSAAVFAIPFLLPDVFVDAAEAKLTCLKLLADSLEDIKSLLIPEDEEDNSAEDTEYPELVTRTYLQDKADFRSEVLSSDMPDEIKNYYRLKWLPKRIWVTEINLLDGYSNAPNGTAVRVGEILLDPASEPEDGHFLSIHLGADLLPFSPGTNGVVIDRNAFNGNINAFLMPGQRYSPLVRAN